ncbi:MAG: hypothetical protein R3F11_14185 [Verrucomicrobiales bacterium]
MDGELELVAVEEGAITGENKVDKRLPANTFLFWTGGEVATSSCGLAPHRRFAKANSGIMFRAEDLPNFEAKGYQADMDRGEPLGVIYDEHGRALLAERGSRVLIAPDGTRGHRLRGLASLAGVAKDGAWNEYRSARSAPPSRRGSTARS